MSDVTEIATLGGGCFWCLEAVFQGLRGVHKVTSGYAGGHTATPNYRDVCEGQTGHAEVVQVTFDPAELSYADLLRIFFVIHDPTTPDRQGHDIGTQYRSIILTHSDSQGDVARSVIAELEAMKLYAGKFVTQLVPLTVFHPAEEYHHDYFARNPGAGYCQAVVAPKVAKFRASFADRLKA
jgi:peptide-methionine (S)-S-oxide reductase